AKTTWGEIRLRCYFIERERPIEMAIDVRDRAENAWIRNHRGLYPRRELENHAPSRVRERSYAALLAQCGEERCRDLRDSVVGQGRYPSTAKDLREGAALARFGLDEEHDVARYRARVHAVRLTRRDDHAGVLGPLLSFPRSKPNPKFRAECDLNGIMRMNRRDGMRSTNEHATAVPRHEMPD